MPPFDPNYHKPTDTLDHIDRTALGINGGGAAYAAAPLRAGHHRTQRHPAARRPSASRTHASVKPRSDIL